jgi:hypothetical protein
MSSTQILPSRSTSTTRSTNSRPPIIGLSGKIGAGKTYLAMYMLTRYGYPKTSFADRLKEDIQSLGFAHEKVYRIKPPHIRKLLQIYGQAWRAEDPYHWIIACMDSVHRLQKLAPNVPVVIDDVRFANECEVIREKGGIIIRLENTGKENDDSDVSETELDDYDFDHVIAVGGGELEELQEAMNDVLYYEGWLDG